MDPVTAALNLINKILDLQIVTINAMASEDRAAYGKLQLEQMQKWYDFLNRVADIFHSSNK